MKNDSSNNEKLERIQFEKKYYQKYFIFSNKSKFIAKSYSIQNNYVNINVFIDWRKVRFNVFKDINMTMKTEKLIIQI